MVLLGGLKMKFIVLGIEYNINASNSLRTSAFRMDLFLAAG